jgi:hypothetical protein
MALRALDNIEHSKLLHRINNMPFEDRHAEKFEQQLTKFYEECHTMLIELAVVIEQYREVAAKINARQPLVKRKEPQETF